MLGSLLKGVSFKRDPAAPVSTVQSLDLSGLITCDLWSSLSMCLLNNQSFWFQLRWNKFTPPCLSHWNQLKTKTQYIIKPAERFFFLLLVSLGLDLKATQTQNCAPRAEGKNSKRRLCFWSKKQEKEPLKVKVSRGNPSILLVFFLFSPVLPQRN